MADITRLLLADITRLLLGVGLEIANKTKKIPKNVCFHLKQKMQRKNGILKNWLLRYDVFPMFNKNNRIVYMLQFISLYNSSKTFHIPYLYTYTTRIAQKLVRSQYHLPGETTHRTNTPSNITQPQEYVWHGSWSVNSLLY